MNTKIFIIALGFTLTISGAATVLAEPVQATVASINPENKSMTLTPQQPGQNLPASFEVSNVDQSFFEPASGINSLEELSVGDEITVEANRNFFGNWNVERIVEGPAPFSSEIDETGAEQRPADQQDQEAFDATEGWLTGRVVSLDRDNRQITVIDYATGSESILTIVDMTLFDTLKEGDPVRVQQSPLMTDAGTASQSLLQQNRYEQFQSEQSEQFQSEQGTQQQTAEQTGGEQTDQPQSLGSEIGQEGIQETPSGPLGTY